MAAPDDPWAEHGLLAESREAIGRFLLEQRQAIVEAGTSWVVQSSVDLRGRRPLEETQRLVERVVELHFAWLLHGELEPRRRFVEFVTSYRASAQFHMSTLLRGFSSFKKGVEALLWRSPLSSDDRLRLLMLIDRCSQDVIFEMSDVYVGKLNETIRRVREQEVRAEAHEAQLRLERERNQALAQAKQAADAANAAKSRFLAHMSHELRTPLNSVLGFSQYLLHDEGLSDDHRRTVDNIHQSGEALLEMIDEVLEMSRIEAGAVVARLGTVDLAAFLEQLRTILTPHVAPGVRFEVRAEGELPPYVRTDRSKLRQILVNLLGNALKFTQAGHVTCTVRAGDAALGAPTLEFRVEDTGPGISQQELPTVFDAFVQTESGQASGRGVGLGLAISRSYVELLGGSLRVTSVVGEGTTFAFALPVALDRAEERDPWQACTTEQASAFAILVVDDHQTNRELLRMTLERWGFRVDEAAGGHEAVHKALEGKPDLVFMDLRMGDLDGLEAARRIRARMGAQAPVIVALTASVFGNVREQARAAGCDEFLLKPFDFGTIARVIHARLVLARRSSEPPPAAGRMQPASAVLPEAERERLRLAAVQLDLARFQHWLADAGELDADTRASLEGWIEDFEFGKVLQWIET